MKTFDSIKMLRGIKHVYSVTISLADTFAVAHSLPWKSLQIKVFSEEGASLSDAEKAKMDISS